MSHQGCWNKFAFQDNPPLRCLHEHHMPLLFLCICQPINFRSFINLELYLDVSRVARLLRVTWMFAWLWCPWFCCMYLLCLSINCTSAWQSWFVVGAVTPLVCGHFDAFLSWSCLWQAAWYVFSTVTVSALNISFGEEYIPTPQSILMSPVMWEILLFTCVSPDLLC